MTFHASVKPQFDAAMQPVTGRFCRPVVLT